MELNDTLRRAVHSGNDPFLRLLMFGQTDEGAEGRASRTVVLILSGVVDAGSNYKDHHSESSQWSSVQSPAVVRSSHRARECESLRAQGGDLRITVPTCAAGPIKGPTVTALLVVLAWLLLWHVTGAARSQTAPADAHTPGQWTVCPPCRCTIDMVNPSHSESWGRRSQPL